MTIKQDIIIDELKLRIKFLEKQENQMAERMEEKLLLWLVSETINQTCDRDELLYNLIERISIIRDIPYCACFKISDNDVKLLASYFTTPEFNKDICNFKFSPSLIKRLKSEPCFINKDSFDSEGITFNDNFYIQPESVSIFPFQSLYIPFGIFMFFETDDKKNNLSSVSIVIKQIISMAIEKLEKLAVLEELKELNISFEKKLQERTKKLSDYNKELKDEIKERNRSEKKLIMNKERVEKSDKLKTSFLSNISHEIRTPINGILGFSEIIRKDDLHTDEKEKYTNIIKACGKSLLKIIDDVIDLSKIESNQIQLNIEEFFITKFVTELYDFFINDELFKQRQKVELRLNININGSTMIKSDREKLQQILINLVGNALKYTEEGYIEIGSKIEEGKYNGANKDLLFFVKDTGLGIPEDMHESVFEPFVKIEHDISKLYGGTGLGLTITKNLVELFGGKVWLKSKPGKGSEFYFTLPDSVLVVNGQEKLITTGEIRDNYNWDGKLVLIVEDDEMSLIYLKEVLKSTNINIIHASDGEQAIEFAHNNPDIDLILMDIKLPEINGYEATRKIKYFRKSVPIIAQTAYAMADDRQKSLQVGCDDYISKPINRHKLLYTMDVLMKEHSFA
ncbi:MAG: response regulator [Bacteroidetes bacterium]|nr:response regulator [Bacteroidota bacterium]MBL7104077.1 response regulator [Bacteroidales bacterium]